jgi:hypothetical protein
LCESYRHWKSVEERVVMAHLPLDLWEFLLTDLWEQLTMMDRKGWMEIERPGIARMGIEAGLAEW